MEGSCMELALEGERLCKAGDCQTGVQFFEAAIQIGTDDLKTIGAIYSQLGNAYFYLQEYSRALEYHRHDLNLARTLGDRLGEAKASGNLGNTLKVLGKFDEAVVCCQRHLDISRELGDKIGESRALYNMGNVYHAKGKQVGRSAHQDPGEFPPEVKVALLRAAEYYDANLNIVRMLKDRAAEGRACGNLGNTHYLLGNFSQAIIYHLERLAIAKEFGDKSAERRAYSNLGNAQIFLGEFETAADFYKKTLQIGQELCDRALEAQACYSLGNTYTLLQDYEKAIRYHLQHLQIAQELGDHVGEGRACWSLGNANTALGHHQRALHYATKHLQISEEICDQLGQATAQMNLTDLRNILGLGIIQNLEENICEQECDALKTADGVVHAAVEKPSKGSQRRYSMENLQLVRLTPDKTSNCIEASSEAEDCFFDLLSRSQSRRFDDQRCSIQMLERVVASPSACIAKDSTTGSTVKNQNPSTQQTDEFLDMVAGIQGSRMNDQRAYLPNFPGLCKSDEVVGKLLANKKADSALDDHFFEMLMRCQNSRIDDQRSELPVIPAAPTVPDEDFFTLVQRLQSNRIEEQRTTIPTSPKRDVKKK